MTTGKWRARSWKDIDMAWRYTVEELARILQTAAPDCGAAFSGVSTDTRSLVPGQVFFALSGEHFDGNGFVPEAIEKGAVAAVTNRPVEGKPCIVVENPLQALQAFAAHHRAQYAIPVIAITGSCGKTTTKDLLASLLSTRYRTVKTQGNLNNDIGCPLSLLQIDGDTQCAIIEMGANHVGEIRQLCAIARPTESAVTMVGPAHLEGFGCIESVAAAKAEIAESLPADGCFYVNMDNPWCVRIAESFPGRKVRFGQSGDVVLKWRGQNVAGETRLLIEPVGEIRLPLSVPAHASNVLLAIAVGLQHGLTDFEEPLRQAYRNAARFKIGNIGPLEILDDSYNANPSSMAASIEALAERPVSGARMAALGSMLELGGAAAQLHYETGQTAGRLGITHLFARGPNAADMVSGARAAGVLHAAVIEDHGAMAAAIHAAAHPGDALLLKGSRGMRMEQILPLLRTLYGEAGQ